MPTHHSQPNIPLPLPLVILITVTIIVVDLRVAMYFIHDLYKPERRVYGGNKDTWAAIILFGSIIGMLAYLLIGREA
ncbi:MAG TPA: PLDc N-terminal domain-containing protein [Ktedonobacterales bacterium]|nr:PLDc N-terminal domain-containing protein [Ktedonobacterales bacterium]